LGAQLEGSSTPSDDVDGQAPCPSGSLDTETTYDSVGGDGGVYTITN
jgi:hypothetical protein